MSLFGGHEFPHQRDHKPYLKVYMKKLVIRIYRMVPRMMGCGGFLPTLGATGISR
jgi:hypothetical protein